MTWLNPRNAESHINTAEIKKCVTSVNNLQFIIGYRFVDTHSNNNFNYAYSNFRSRNTRDSLQNFSMNYEVPGLIERKAFYVGKLDYNYKAYLIFFGLIGLLWPYSLWFE